MGYAIFQVVRQADTIGNRLKEVQDSVQVTFILITLQEHKSLIHEKDLAKFGKMVKLVSFAPFQ